MHAYKDNLRHIFSVSSTGNDGARPVTTGQTFHMHNYTLRTAGYPKLLVRNTRNLFGNIAVFHPYQICKLSTVIVFFCFVLLQIFLNSFLMHGVEFWKIYWWWLKYIYTQSTYIQMALIYFCWGTFWLLCKMYVPNDVLVYVLK